MNLLDVISKRYLLTSTNLRIPESLIINVVSPHRYSADHEGGKILYLTGEEEKRERI
jgi:hypothetical protein